MVVAVAVGAVVVATAILGFGRLVQFPTICIPWIFVVFFAIAVAVLSQLTGAAPRSVPSRVSVTSGASPTRVPGSGARTLVLPSGMSRRLPALYT